MSDWELLAKAATVAPGDVRWEVDFGCYSSVWSDGQRTRWDPLANDADALKLMVALRMHVGLEEAAVTVWRPRAVRQRGFFCEALGDDVFAATRRAIVRAAAACA